MSDIGEETEEPVAEPVNLCTSFPMDEVVAAVESYDDDEDMQPFEMVTDEADRCTVGNTPYGNYEVSLGIVEGNGSSTGPCEFIDEEDVVEGLGDDAACIRPGATANENIVRFTSGGVDYSVALEGAEWFMYGDDGEKTEDSSPS